MLLATLTTSLAKGQCKSGAKVDLRLHAGSASGGGIIHASHISCVVVPGVQYPTRIDATAQNISSLALCPGSTGSVSSPLVSASTSSLLSGSPASQQSQITMVLLRFSPTGDAHSGIFIKSKIPSILCMCTLCTSCTALHACCHLEA